MQSRRPRWAMNIRTIVAAVVAAVAAAGCAPTVETPAVTAPPPVGRSALDTAVERHLIPPAAQSLEILPGELARAALLIPLSGPSTPIGQALLNAAQIALFDVAESNFVMQIYDTRSTPEGAAEAAARAVSEGAQIILGPVFAADARVAGEVTFTSGVNVVTFSTDPSVADGNVYVMGFVVREQVRDIVSYARGQGHTRFAVMAPDTPYGAAVVEAFKGLVPLMGGEITRTGIYAADAANLENVVKEITDFTERHQALIEERKRLEEIGNEESEQELTRLEEHDAIGDVAFDAILLPDQGVGLTRAASLLPYYDVDSSLVQILGTMLWNTLGSQPALVGGWFPAPSPEGNHSFMVRYRELYGQAPPTIASHGYDAVALAGALARAGMARPFGVEALTSPNGFAGVDGIFRFRPDGLPERSFAIMEVTREGPKLVRPGATSFAGTGL